MFLFVCLDRERFIILVYTYTRTKFYNGTIEWTSIADYNHGHRNSIRQYIEFVTKFVKPAIFVLYG